MPRVAVFVLALSACSSIPSTAPEEARVATASIPHAGPEADGSATPPVTAMLPGDYELAYSASVESSCSESYDYSQWSGTSVVRAGADGNSKLELTIRSSSSGGAWADPDSRYARDSPEERCTFEGKAKQDGSILTLRLTPLIADGADVGFECEAAYRAAPDAKPSDPWVLRCQLGAANMPTRAYGVPSERVSALACQSEGNVPWLWRLLEKDGEPIRLGVGRILHAAAHDSDSLVGTLAGVPEARGPAQWVEPEPEPR